MKRKHNNAMKRIATILILTVLAVSGMAQKSIPVGVRMEATEIAINDDQYSLFVYRDKDSTLGYYLSIGHADCIVEATIGNLGSFSLGSYDEVCLCLGATIGEAYASLDTLLALVDLPVGSELVLPARGAKMSRYLGDYGEAVCYVEKPILASKRIVFYFDHGHYSTQSYLTRSSIKSLRRGLKFYQKLHKL
ncbi:MAG: hypothetical protein IJ789_07650 [Bacteroidales bacterium]|nr:hypothetical protein [Bacteroidales bacterium]